MTSYLNWWLNSKLTNLSYTYGEITVAHSSLGLFADCRICSIKPERHPMYQKLHTFIFHDPAALHKKYCCKYCGSYYRGNQNLVQHILKEHEGNGVLQCDHCKKYFFTKKNFELHINFGCCANPKRAKLECHMCERKFTNEQKLREHVIGTHVMITEGIFVL